MRRRSGAFALTALLFLAATTLLVGLRYYSNSALLEIKSLDFSPGDSSKSVDNAEPDLSKGSRLQEGNVTLFETASTYVNAIMTPEDVTFNKLSCPMPAGTRYNYLRPDSTVNTVNAKSVLKYFFALDLHQSIEVLPRLLGSLVETIRFLGPTHCAVSIVEGRSDDGTLEVLKLMTAQFDRLGVKYYFHSSDIDPYGHSNGKSSSSNRIKALSQLRGLAIAPLIDHPADYSPDAVVVFLNDVAICMEDILELIHQRVFQHADMTCAMDWTYVGADPTFYDVWVARGMNGDSFFEIPSDGSWDLAWKLFWNNPLALQRWGTAQPFQVFSCWNGAVVFTAAPLLEGRVGFRSVYEGECTQGEPQLFCKDLWFHGYGKIAVVPAVNLEYSNEAAERIKAAKGYVSNLLNGNPVQIDWELNPPKKVKCIPTYAQQTWVAWDEGLNEHQQQGDGG